MSNTKWRKLIKAISPFAENASSCIVKFVDVPEAKPTQTPHEREIRRPSYLDSQFGPFRFKSIEWLEFPRSVVRVRYEGDPGLEIAQDIGALRMAIEACGRFPIEETNRGFRIIGHILRQDGAQPIVR